LILILEIELLVDLMGMIELFPLLLVKLIGLDEQIVDSEGLPP
jgi:hypothetical protein